MSQIKAIVHFKGKRKVNPDFLISFCFQVVTGDFSGNLLSWKLLPDQIATSDPVLMAQFDVSVKNICLQGKNIIILLGKSLFFCLFYFFSPT